MSPAFGVDGLIEWLLWQSIYASVAGIAVFGLTKGLRIRDPRWLTGLWTLVLLRFLLPVDLALPWGLGSAWARLIPPVVGQVGDETEAAASVGFAGVVEVPGQPGVLAIIIALAWTAGVMSLFFIMARQQLQTRRLLLRAAPAGSEAQDRMLYWRREFGIRRPVRFIVGEVGLLPFTTGLLAPTIFVSQRQLDLMAPQDLDAVLVHELAHIRSLDVVWLCLERVVQLLFFFHPVAWWATRGLSQARERSCDIQAVKRSGMNAQRYWEAVLNLLDGAKAPARLTLTSSLGRSGRSLKDRIDAVRFYSHPRANSRVVAYAGITALSVLLLPMAPAAHNVPATVPSVEAGTASALTSTVQVASARVVEAKEKLDRYTNGDFGDRVIIRPDGKAICAPHSWPEGVRCDGVFSSGDIEQLIWEAENELSRAEQTVALQARPRQ